MTFEIIGKISNVEKIAVGNSIRDIRRLRMQYGKGRWKKMKGIAKVRFMNGETKLAEVHWYEAHGIGKRKMKVKYVIGD